MADGQSVLLWICCKTGMDPDLVLVHNSIERNIWYTGL